jgi:hypothetical protein
VFVCGSPPPKQALALTRPATVTPANIFNVIDVIILFIDLFSFNRRVQKPHEKARRARPISMFFRLGYCEIIFP